MRCLFILEVIAFQIITNNPMVCQYLESHPSRHTVCWQDGDLAAVLVKARDLIHLGWRLHNHPLASSLKPNQTPYKTLVLSPGTNLDHQSLRVLEGALALVKSLGSYAGGHQALFDLQLIDLETSRDVFSKR